MQCNVGPDERILRFALAVGCHKVAKFVPRGIGLRGLLNIIALSELVTAATAYCPLNQVLGINTCRPEQMRARGDEQIVETESSMPTPQPVGL